VSAFSDVALATCRILADDGTTAGTGFFVLPSGRLLTCHHVVCTQHVLRVLIPGEPTPRPARYVEECSNPARDLAVLDVAGPPAAVQLGALREGTAAIGLGFRPTEVSTEPLGHTFSGTLAAGQELRIAPGAEQHGAIASLREPSPWNTLPEDYRVGRVANFVGSVGLQRGISGGPVFDPELRRVVGMFRAVEGGELAYVIPLDDVLAGASDLLERNRLEVADGLLDALVRDFGLGLVAEGARPATPRTRRYFAALLESAELIGGRVDELRQLAQHAANGHPYVFVTGPAGFGKTGVLARWIVERLARGDPLVFHFISRDEPATSVLHSLVEQLLAVHGLGGQLPQQERDLRLLYADLLMLPAPTDRGVLVVLDGLDEAIGTCEMRPDIFPPRLPLGTRVVFSAQEIAGTAWPAQLGLDLPAPQTIRLGALAREEIADAVTRAGASPSITDAATALITEISDGDPIYVHDLLVELTATHGELTSLRDVRGTHSEYLRRWWRHGVEECGEREFTDLLGLLAFAHGPLAREDLVSVAPDDSLRGANIDALLDRARRYLSGDDRSGYSVSHSRIRAFVRALLADDADLYRRRLADYCTGPVRSEYVLLNAAEHVGDVYGPERFGELLDEHWIAASWEHFGSYDHLINDLAAALDASARSEPPQPASIAGLAIARQTARELLRGLPTSLLVAWIRLGRAERVLSIARALPAERGHAAKQLIAIARELLRDATRTSAVVETLSSAVGMLPTLRGSGTQREHFEEVCEVLAPGGLPADASVALREQANSAAAAIDDPATRAYIQGALTAVAVALGSDGRPLLAQARATLELVDHGPDRLTVQARLLPALVTIEPDAGMRLIDALLADEALFEASSLGTSAAGAFARALCALASPEPLEALGARCLAQPTLDGAAVGIVAVGLLKAGREAPAGRLLEAAYARADAEPVEVTRTLLEWVGDAPASAAEQWHARLNSVAAMITEESFPPPLLVRAIEAGDIELASVFVARFPTDGSNLGAALTALDRLGAPDQATVTPLLDRLGHLIVGDSDAPDRWAALGSVLLRYDTAAGAELVERAARSSLGDLPEGDTDGLRRLSAAGWHEAGRFAQAVGAATDMKWISNAAGALGSLIQEAVATHSPSAVDYAAALADVVRTGAGQPLYSEALGEATRAISVLAETQGESALALFERARRGWLFGVGERDVTFDRGVADLAAARAGLDGNPTLFLELLDRAEQWAAHGRVDAWAHDGRAAKTLEALLVAADRASASLADDVLTTLTERASAVAAQFGDNGDRAALDRALALARGRRDPEVAVALLQHQIDQLAERIRDGAEPMSPELLAFMKMVGEFMGEQGVVAFQEVAEARAIANALVRLAAGAADAALPLLRALTMLVAEIRTRPDAVNALTEIISACAEAPPELHPQLTPVMADALRQAVAKDGEGGGRAAGKVFVVLLKLDEPDLVRELLYPFVDDEIKVFIEQRMATVERQRTRGFVDRSCAELVSDPDLLPELDAGRPETVVGDIARSLARNGDASRLDLLGGPLCLLAVAVWRTAGAEGITAIIESIAEYDRRFVDAAAAVARQRPRE
jgi:hypothetical protein